MDAQVKEDAPGDAARSALLETIFERYHYDFRRYAEASLKRRLDSAVVHLGCRDVAALTRRLLDEPLLFSELLRFLTVQVSDLFRDPDYFRTIRQQIVPLLRTYPSLRLWVAGCATGEEAYSLAIVLLEEGLLDRAQIYATDIHPSSLQVAAEGVYPLERFAQFSQNYLLAGGRGSLSDYYTASDSSAVLHRALKKSILFADHSLATDSVFAEMELISCRNVLIYFERSLQERAVALLRDSLCRRGFLGLGAKESLRFTSQAPRFSEFAPEQRIYQRL